MRTRNELETIYLTGHQQHIEILSRLRKPTRRIVIVQVDGEVKDDPLIVNALSMMELITKRQTREWFSTKTFGTPGVEYVFQKKRKFFDFLTGYDAFFVSLPPSEYDRKGYRVEYTDFDPSNDIAFLDENGQLLFYTCTHEGIAMIHPDVLKADISYLY